MAPPGRNEKFNQECARITENSQPIEIMKHRIRNDVRRNPTTNRDPRSGPTPKKRRPGRERRVALGKAISRRADALEQSFLSASDYCPPCL